MTTKTCNERINDHYESTMDDLRLLWAGYMQEECPKCEGTGEVYTEDQVTVECEYCEGTGHLDDEIPDLGSLFDYGLSFDYVAPETFTNQEQGYFRYQLSWGGPSDEFRIYAEQIKPYSWYIYKIEYWFLDWFDGAHIMLTGDDKDFMVNLLQTFFVKSGSFDSVHDDAMKDL